MMGVMSSKQQLFFRLSRELLLQQFPRRVLSFALLFVFVHAFVSTNIHAGDAPVVSQGISVRAPIEDEFGHALVGENGVGGDFVQILLATDGVAYPPDASGNPHPLNTLITSSYIGDGVSPVLRRSGMFGHLLSPRPGGGSKIFVRVFNAPTTQDASFYGDSSLFEVDASRNPTFVVDIESASSPMDTTDVDGDGLVGSWEKSFGTDANNADTDGDGMGDGGEVLGQYDPLDSQSNLAIVRVLPAGGDNALLRWDSIEGVSYRLEYTADSLAAAPTFIHIATVTGDPDVTEYVVVDGLADLTRCYRVVILK